MSTRATVAELEAEVEQRPHTTRRQMILACVCDLIGAFLYYDRKEDDDLPRDVIQEAIKAGEISRDEIVNAFGAWLDEGLR